MASLILRNKKYWISYYVNGKRVRKSLNTSDKSFAKRLLSDFEHKLNHNQTIISNDKILISSLLEKYYKTLELISSKDHFYNRKIMYKQFLEWSCIHYVQQITPELIQNYLLFRKRQDRSDWTIKNDFNAIRAFITWCIDNEYIEKNPCRKIRIPKTEKKEPEILTPEQQLLLIESAKDMPIYHMIILALYTGIRAGELKALTWNCFDWKKYTLTIRSESAKSKKFRVIKFNANLKEYLLPIIKLSGLCFNYYTIPPEKQWKRLKKITGLTDLKWHHLRHTYISTLIMAGADIKTVSEYAGHADANLTLNTYSHLYEKHKENIVKNIDVLKNSHNFSHNLAFFEV